MTIRAGMTERQFVQSAREQGVPVKGISPGVYGVFDAKVYFENGTLSEIADPGL